MTGCKMCGLWHGAIRPAGRPKKAWRDMEKDCQSRQLNKEDAMGHSKWRQLKSLSINDKNRERVGECFCDTGSPWLSWIESHEKIFVFVEFKRLAKKNGSNQSSTLRPVMGAYSFFFRAAARNFGNSFVKPADMRGCQNSSCHLVQGQWLRTSIQLVLLSVTQIVISSSAH